MLYAEYEPYHFLSMSHGANEDKEKSHVRISSLQSGDDKMSLHSLGHKKVPETFFHLKR